MDNETSSSGIPKKEKSREEKKKELRNKLKAMKDARSGKTFATTATEQMSNKDKKKMRKVSNSHEVDKILEQFGLKDPNVKASLKKSINEGRIKDLDDLANFLSKFTDSPVTTTQLIQQQQQNPSTPMKDLEKQSSEEALLLFGNDVEKEQRPKFAKPKFI